MDILSSFSSSTLVLSWQIAVLVVGIFIVYLVLFATRDILLRTHSLFFQLFCILLVALLPVIGFLFYLLIRPSRLLAEREFEKEVREVLKRFSEKHEHQHQKKKENGKGK